MSQSNWPAPSMMLTTSAWAKIKSFSLMPVSNDCPFVECLYNPVDKVLAIIGKTKKDTFHMVPRLDDAGGAIRNTKSSDPNKPNKMQRVQQESYTEYYITEKEEVINFIKQFAVNHEDFDYMAAIDMKTMDNASDLATGPQLILEK